MLTAASHAAAIWFATLPVAAGAALVQMPPSGTSVDLFEVLIDDVGGESWLRFRFLAPQIARADGIVTYSDLVDDFAYLCERVALPYLAEYDLNASVIVVSLLDRPVAFGAADPDATQFIDAFRVTSGACEWEAF
ncbi:MAG: DUF6497 family protein [Roseobacter sp.]